MVPPQMHRSEVKTVRFVLSASIPGAAINVNTDRLVLS
jgi:hypothetical protein